MGLLDSFFGFIGVIPESAASIRNRRKKIDFIFRELFEQLIEEISSSDLTEEEREKLESMVDDALMGDIDASVVYRAEMVLIQKLDIDGLRLRIRTLRELLAGLLAPDAYASFERGFISDLSAEVSMIKLRAEAAALVSRAYRRYALVPSVEYQRSAIVTRMAVWLLISAILLSGFAYVWNWAVFYPLALVAGAIGAAMSVTMRLYQIDPRHEPLLTWLSLEQGKYSIFLSPILGAVFGFVFLVIVRANLVSGDMFPDFKADVWRGMRLSDHGCFNLSVSEVNLKGHIAECGSAYLQYAKVAVWAFIAGWAERMVPDVLNKLSQQPQVTSQKN